MSRRSTSRYWRSVNFVVLVLFFRLLSACSLLPDECTPRNLTLVVHVSAEELDDALDDDGELSTGECKRLCPTSEVQIVGCAIVEPSTSDSDTGAEPSVACEVTVSDDCN